jgi:hypothetical protein
MTTLPISTSYREAVKGALVLQVMTALLLLMVLDGGVMAQAGGAAMIGFWIGVGIVMLRRPRTPTKVDLLYVRWGFLPMLVVAIAWSPFMGALRG